MQREIPRGIWKLRFGATRGTWIWKLNWSEGWKILLCCPKCSTVGELDHEVDSIGQVTPSVQCSNPACDFHEEIKLLKFSQPEDSMCDTDEGGDDYGRYT